jgi:hypothetical protein
MAADVEPEDLPRARFRLLRALRELDPPGLPAPAREHLRLHDDRASELLRRRPRLLRRLGQPTVGDRDAEAGKELFSLVLVQVHRRGESIRCASAPGAAGLPSELGPGQQWSGAFSGQRLPPRGFWRIRFGYFVGPGYEGSPGWNWITDHVLRL